MIASRRPVWQEPPSRVGWLAKGAVQTQLLIHQPDPSPGRDSRNY